MTAENAALKILHSMIDAALYSIEAHKAAKQVFEKQREDSRADVIRLYHLEPPRNQPDSWAKFITKPFVGHIEELLPIERCGTENSKAATSLEEEKGNTLRRRAVVPKIVNPLDGVQFSLVTASLEDPRYFRSDSESNLLLKVTELKSTTVWHQHS
jgi:hypothetical protein